MSLGDSRRQGSKPPQFPDKACFSLMRQGLLLAKNNADRTWPFRNRWAPRAIINGVKTAQILGIIVQIG